MIIETQCSELRTPIQNFKRKTNSPWTSQEKPSKIFAKTGTCPNTPKYPQQYSGGSKRRLFQDFQEPGDRFTKNYAP